MPLTDKAATRSLCLGLALAQAQAFATTELDACLLTALKSADANTRVQQIRAACLTNKPAPEPKLTSEITAELNQGSKDTELAQISRTDTAAANGMISSRLIAERTTAFDPFVITPHKMNYLLPASITDNVNTEVYQGVDAWSENLTNTEAKFQLSIKVPLNREDLFIQNDGLFFGFTLQSWWQVYSDNISKPFRETNYQPEVFYLAPLNWHPAGGNTGFALGLEHQSNGRSQLLSRSWNRLYLNFLYEKDNFALSFRPWWRLPESKKQNPLDSDGDDNPDINDYMGHFELALVYKWSDYEWTSQIRENFARHHGALELGFTFPLWGKLRGYAQYSLGYGESLIDYNHSQQRFGLGIALTDVL
ncbi:phospholipase A [Thalassomonas actiniarum]|uniref:Phospholipase A1 n=1 Tax=Thalassomonas actiniarum TaxID=485447 RepID=A0AAE9YME3_9GAMM|nr:phospholipase A [Thalassomonas actiniarum]WDD97770.1 phospholipase A [Thalassomonas actiniarum]